MIVALMSTWQEGRLALAAARSALTAADALFVLDAPIGHAGDGGDPTPLEAIARLGTDENAVCVDEDPGPYPSDAAKRTALLDWAREVCGQGGQEFWIVWIDGDELLMHGEYLGDYVARAKAERADGFPLRIVELDGSVAKAPCRVVRGDKIARCVKGAFVIETTDGIVTARPNVPLCAAGGVPVSNTDGTPVTLEQLADKRPPLIGEPHLLHRSMLRDPGRDADRVHLDEVATYDEGKGY